MKNSTKTKNAHFLKPFFQIFPLILFFYRTLSFSSVVISLCYVARGSIDAYVIEDMYPWDVAAGSLLITEAGGYISNINGDKFDLMKVSLICGSKKELCTEIIKLVHEADQIKCLNE